MAAVQALAGLVHCPATPNSLQAPRFPLAGVLGGDDMATDSQQTAALQSLRKARSLVVTAVVCGDQYVLFLCISIKNVKMYISIACHCSVHLDWAASYTDKLAALLADTCRRIVPICKHTPFVNQTLVYNLFTVLHFMQAEQQGIAASVLNDVGCLQVQLQVAEGLAATRCGVAGIRSSLMHSPYMLKKGLQLLLVVLRLSTAACEAAISSSFPQVSHHSPPHFRFLTLPMHDLGAFFTAFTNLTH